jgi:hypothetical protein
MNRKTTFFVADTLLQPADRTNKTTNKMASAELATTFNNNLGSVDVTWPVDFMTVVELIKNWPQSTPTGGGGGGGDGDGDGDSDDGGDVTDYASSLFCNLTERSPALSNADLVAILQASPSTADPQDTPFYTIVNWLRRHRLHKSDFSTRPLLEAWSSQCAEFDRAAAAASKPVASTKRKMKKKKKLKPKKKTAATGGNKRKKSSGSSKKKTTTTTRRRSAVVKKVKVENV